MFIEGNYFSNLDLNWFFVALSIALLGLLIFFIIKYYRYKLEVTNDKLTQKKNVIFRDFQGNSHIAGEFLGYSIEKGTPTVLVAPKGDVEHFISYQISTPGNQVFNCSIEYEKEIMIFVDFDKSNIENRKMISPLHKQYINVGLIHGIEQIKNMVAPIYQENDDLRALLSKAFDQMRIISKNSVVSIFDNLLKNEKSFLPLLKAFEQRSIAGIAAIEKEYEKARQNALNISEDDILKISSLYDPDPLKPKNNNGDGEFIETEKPEILEENKS